MKNRVVILIIFSFIFTSCGIFKTHHKKNLLDFENNSILNRSLKLNGYFFSEEEREYGEYAPYPIQEYIKETGIKKIKYITVFFIYEDGFVIELGGINGLTHYFCANKSTYENTYESAHKTVELMLESQNSVEKRAKRVCGFMPDDINHKGLIQIQKDSLKLQVYRIEKQNPEYDSFNSAYLYESNGIITSDTTFVIKNKTEFRTNKTADENSLFQFRETKQKPKVGNYFKENKNQFKRHSKH